MCAQMKRLADLENREQRDHSYFPEEVREKLDIEIYFFEYTELDDEGRAINKISVKLLKAT